MILWAVGLVFQGIRGDMRPFAKIMLALAALRENHEALARIQLLELVNEFPENPIFARELEKLGPPPRP